jgi:hypothetical protein
VSTVPRWYTPEFVRSMQPATLRLYASRQLVGFRTRWFAAVLYIQRPDVADEIIKTGVEFMWGKTDAQFDGCFRRETLSKRKFFGIKRVAIFGQLKPIQETLGNGVVLRHR